jgi:crossover junction endodeoxyribonuclease RusA
MGVATMTRIVLPWPAKELNPNRRGWGKGAMHRHARLSKGAKELAHWTAKEAGWHRADTHENYCLGEDRPTITITFCPPDNRRRDLDNLLASFKSSLDGIAAALGIDDSLWTPIPRRGEVVKGGKVVVELTA